MPNRHQAHRDGYVVNFGAHFNVRAARTSFFDPTSAAMRKPGARGLAVDADDAMPWAAASVSKRTTFLKPGDMAGMLDAVGVPPEPRLFKIDIDSFDVAVALAVLDARSPEFITCEVQEVVPPPACYCNDVYRDGWERLDGDAYGCSLVGYANAFATRTSARDTGATFSNYPISAVSHSFRLMFRRAIVPRSALEAWMLCLERARARHTHG